MKDLRIIFMGTPEFAVGILEGILQAGYKVCGVVTAPDRPAGRGRKLQQSAVKMYAVTKGLPVLQPTNLKSPEFISDLKGLDHNLQVVVAFRMLPEVVWKMPEYGTFNLHASLLPQYRGAAPINWAIIKGETVTGVSTFFIDDKIDTGEIILRKEVSIGQDENAGELHDKLKAAGTGLVLETLDQLKLGITSSRKQEASAALKEAPKLTKENTKINWEAPLEDIYNFIRGLNPYPGAWCYFQNGKEQLLIKIFDVEVEKTPHDLPAGTVIAENRNLKVAVSGGFLNLLVIQFPGKRKMKTRELLNGYQLENNINVL